MAIKCWAIIPAAGIGQRFNHHMPKQYLQVQQKTLLEHTINLFVSEPSIAQIMVPIAEQDTIFSTLSFPPEKVQAVKGGGSRCESVLKALCFLESSAHANDWVLVHDAVRPCLHPADLRQLIYSVKDDEIGGLLAIPCVDSMKWVEAGRSVRPVSRDHLWRALTPQMVKFGLLLQLLRAQPHKEFTDEASLLEENGYHPKIIQAQHANPKLTFSDDLGYISYLLQQRQKVEA